MRNLLLVIGVSVITGCGAVDTPYVGKPMMSYDEYETYAMVNALAESCFERGFIDGQLANDAYESTRFYMSGYTIVPSVYGNLHSKHKDFIKNKTTKESCIKGELILRKFVSRSKGTQAQYLMLQQQVLQQAQTNQILQGIKESNTLNNSRNPVTCYNQGSVTQCF